MIHKKHFTFVFYVFFNFYCVSQEYTTLYLETRRSETLENEVFEVKKPAAGAEKIGVLGLNFEIFWMFYNYSPLLITIWQQGGIVTRDRTDGCNFAETHYFFICFLKLDYTRGAAGPPGLLCSIDYV